MTTDPKVSVHDISELIPDQKNANNGTQRGGGMLRDSIGESGLGRGICVDRDLNIIAGNKTVETAFECGLKTAIVVEVTGEQLVVARRTDLDLDSPEGRLLAVRDNRVGEINLDWNQAVLDEMDFDKSKLWTPEEWDELAKGGQGSGRDEGDSSEDTEIVSFQLTIEQKEQVETAIESAIKMGGLAVDGDKRAWGISRVCEIFLGSA